MDFIKTAQLATGILFHSTMMTDDALKGLDLGTTWQVVILEECLGSLSCWKLKSSSPGSTHAATRYDATSAMLLWCQGAMKKQRYSVSLPLLSVTSALCSIPVSALNGCNSFDATTGYVACQIFSLRPRLLKPMTRA